MSIYQWWRACFPFPDLESPDITPPQNMWLIVLFLFSEFSLIIWFNQVNTCNLDYMLFTNMFQSFYISSLILVLHPSLITNISVCHINLLLAPLSSIWTILLPYIIFWKYPQGGNFLKCNLPKSGSEMLYYPPRTPQKSMRNAMCSILIWGVYDEQRCIQGFSKSYNTAYCLCFYFF